MPIRTFSALVWPAGRPRHDREPGTDCAFGIVLMSFGIAEINQHAVAHILGDKTAEAGDGAATQR